MPRTKCPKGTICVESFTLVCFLIILFVIGYFVYKHYIESNNTQNHIELHIPHTEDILPRWHISSQSLYNQLSHESGYDMLRPIARPGISFNDNPKDTLMNPYSPPVQYNAPHEYRQIGYLKNEQYGQKLFPIFAKPQHLRRDKWYYYTIYDNIKVPIYSQGRKCSSEYGCDSLMNGDVVHVESMNQPFMVSLYDNHTLSYEPVI